MHRHPARKPGHRYRRASSCPAKSIPRAAGPIRRAAARTFKLEQYGYTVKVTEPRWLDERELDTWLGFLKVGTIIGRRVEQQLQDDAGLSHSQYEVLARLSFEPMGELRMKELAGIAGTSKSGLSYQVTQLEKAGLVARVSSPDDDRGVIAKLTSQGRRVLRDTAPAHVNLVRELFLDGLTPEQFANFAEAIQALRTWLVDRK